MRRRPVLVYRDFLLPISETFIKSQAEGLDRFIAYYAGLRRIQGIEVPTERVIEFQRKGWLGAPGNAIFKFTGLAPEAMIRIRRVRPVLVHAHFGVDASRVMRVAAALRLPLLVTLHDYDVTTSDEQLRKLAPYCATYIRRRPALGRRATAFIAVSDFLRRRAVARGFPEHKIVVHYIGVDVRRFERRAGAGEPIVLFVGRLAEKKGCRYLIEAMAKVEAAHPEVRLVIAGDGPLRGELEAQAAATLRRCSFVGAQSSDEIRRWYQRARLLCAPSVTAASGETEGLPITVLEAQAVGLPVVSTVHSGIPEAVLHEQTGLLAPERDSEALARHLMTVLRDVDLGARLGAAGAERVRERFDLQKQNAALEDLYARVAADPSRSGASMRAGL